MVDYISYGSTNKISYSSIDWVDKGIMEMKNLGGKGFSQENLNPKYNEFDCVIGFHL